MYKIALELNFVNSIFPSGGGEGFGYLGVRLKKEGVPTSKSTLTLVTRYSLTFVSFIIYLGVALLPVICCRLGEPVDGPDMFDDYFASSGRRRIINLRN